MSDTALLLDEPGGAPRRPQPDGAAGMLTARVAGNALEALDVRDGDRVVLALGRAVEFGDLAALRLDGGARMLWKVHPEADRLHLSNGRKRWTVAAQDVEVVGVVVAVLRRFADGPAPTRDASCPAPRT